MTSKLSSYFSWAWAAASLTLLLSSLGKVEISLPILFICNILCVRRKSGGRDLHAILKLALSLDVGMLEFARGSVWFGVMCVCIEKIWKTSSSSPPHRATWPSWIKNLKSLSRLALLHRLGNLFSFHFFILTRVNFKCFFFSLGDWRKVCSFFQFSSPLDMQKFELCAPWPYVEVKVSLLGSKELMLSFHVVFDRLQHDVESLKKILEHTFLELSGEMLESFSGGKILQRSATKFLAKRKKN